jgi:hypothetical protein
MATAKSKASLLTDFATNSVGAITAVDVQNLIESVSGYCLEVGSAPSPSAGVGQLFTMAVGGETELFFVNTNDKIVQVTNVNGTIDVTATYPVNARGLMTYIKATGQSEGDLHLSDATNWATSTSLIKTIRVETSSTDWDLWLLQNDNSFATDDANIPKMQIVEAGNGDQIVSLDHPYEDEDATDEVHLYYLDNSGANTATIYIMGVTA